MKKIFIGISSVIFAFVIVMLCVMTGVKKNIGFAIEKPDFINVYNKSTTVTSGGEPYEDDEQKNDEPFDLVLKNLEKTTTLSLFQLAQNNRNLNYKIEYDKQNYALYDSSMKNDNLVIELIYRNQKEIVVYENGEQRVIPFRCLIFIIPANENFNEIVVYNALSNDTSAKEEQYKNCTPFILKGIAKDLISYVNTL